tara:strand:+ start:1330 stop:1707 length:378 start_codon:yes stop_codon:yes gene_type:complete
LHNKEQSTLANPASVDLITITKHNSKLTKIAKVSSTVGIIGIFISLRLQIDLYARYMSTISGKTRALFLFKHLNIYPFALIGLFGILILVFAITKKENKINIAKAFMLNLLAVLGILLPVYYYFV